MTSHRTPRTVPHRRPPGWEQDLPVGHPVPAEVVREALAGARRLVVLDDDPTGTQTVRDVPVLTRWSVEDVGWALQQGGPGFFVLTNTRSLDAAGAAARTREVAVACLAAARDQGVAMAFASRSDSTLRGHFPLETDVLAQVLAEHGRTTDAVLLAPAYVDAGRITLDGVHWTVGADGLTPVAEGEFARDATFGYTSSRLADWVQEKSGGRLPAREVAEMRLPGLRDPAPAELRRLLTSSTDGRVVVLDTVTDDDLRAAVLQLLAAESGGAQVLARVGPSFVRARLGQQDGSRIPEQRLAELVGAGGRERVGTGGPSGPAHGLVVIGSHVGLTTRQLDVLRERRAPVELELDVAEVVDPARRDPHLAALVERAVTALAGELVVLRTSRRLVTGADADASLEIARRVSTALVEVTRRVVSQRRPGYLVAKGGITSSDVATGALALHRGWVRGPVLDGIVSLWEAADGAAAGLPYVVFAGNVGDDASLADAVDRLERATGGRGDGVRAGAHDVAEGGA